MDCAYPMITSSIEWSRVLVLFVSLMAHVTHRRVVVKCQWWWCLMSKVMLCVQSFLHIYHTLLTMLSHLPHWVKPNRTERRRIICLVTCYYTTSRLRKNIRKEVHLCNAAAAVAPDRRVVYSTESQLTTKNIHLFNCD